MNTDILIVGSGCSGLYCALHLPRDKKICIITKTESIKSDSFLAQGGICVLRDDDDFDSFLKILSVQVIMRMTAKALRL